MRKQKPSAQYTCLHLAVSVCVAITITLTLILSISSSSVGYMAAISDLMAVLIVGFAYATPFLRQRALPAPMSHLPEADKYLLKLSITGIALCALSPFLLPQGTLAAGSANNKALSIVGITAFLLVPISIAMHTLLLLVARYIRPFNSEGR